MAEKQGYNTGTDTYDSKNSEGLSGAVTDKAYHRGSTSKENYVISDGHGHNYTFDFKNASKSVKTKKIAAVIEYVIRYGNLPTDPKRIGMPDNGARINFNNAIDDAISIMRDAGYSVDSFRNSLLENGYDIYDGNGKNISNQYYDTDENGKRILKETYKQEQEQREIDAEQNAYDAYWNNLYSRNDNTLGKEAYDAMLASERAAGQNAIDLANAQAQQLGMAQAAQVKNITDSLKAERMARLRAGMSESQIASQDMQTMIANTNALNEQIAAQNLNAMQGQQQINNAETTAYQNWLNSMNQTATAGSAFAAADAGNADQLARQYAARTGVTYQKAYDIVTGRNNTGGK